MTGECGVRWLFSSLYQRESWSTPTDGGDDSHSTCVTSKAIGGIYEAAKRAKLVVVKMDDYT